FRFCAERLDALDYGAISRCLDPDAGFDTTFAQALAAGDCDDDGVRNAADLCPCEAASPLGSMLGCPGTRPDAGIGDASTHDATTGDGGPAPGTHFGGGGGCSGCAAAPRAGAPLVPSLLLLLTLAL